MTGYRKPVQELILDGLNSFLRYPADDDYQRGYLAALLALYHPRYHAAQEQLK